MSALNIWVLALEGAPASSATGMLDTLQMAGALSGARSFSAQLVGLRAGPLKMSGSLSITPQRTIEQLPQGGPELIIVPGLGVQIERTLAGLIPLYPWLQARAAAGAQLASVCTGAFALAESGLLDGRIATTHWLLAARFSARYPKVELLPQRLITEDRGVFCSGGANACYDLALFLVERLVGHALARRCAEALVIDQRPNTQVPYANFIVKTAHDSAPIKQVQLWMEEHLAEPVTVDALAAQAKMSPRTFKRRFKEATKETPVAYLQRLRIERAKWLLEGTSEGVEAISARVGYENAAFFRKLFRRYTSQTPLAFRQRSRSTRELSGSL